MMCLKNIAIIFSISLLSWTVQAQSYFSIDRHSTNLFDGWMSCETSDNPNIIRGNGHWIMYDMGQLYLLADSRIWNVNHPDNLDNGIQNMHIDYSVDGVIWNELGIYTMTQSDGSLYYEGVIGPHFNGTKTRYVLFSAIDNYGGDCYGFSEFKINVLDPTLPIELVKFDISCDGDVNTLSWETAQEYNLSHFEVERSVDGTMWKSLTSIESKGSFQLAASYSYEDKANEQYYYRLKANDLDDAFSYSSIVISSCDIQQEDLSVYPNPTNEQTIIGFESKGDFYAYQLFDVFGRVLESKSVSVNSGFTEFVLDVSTFTSGDYYITIQMNDKIMVKKIVVF